MIKVYNPNAFGSYVVIGIHFNFLFVSSGWATRTAEGSGRRARAEGLVGANVHRRHQTTENKQEGCVQAVQR